MQAIPGQKKAYTDDTTPALFRFLWLLCTVEKILKDFSLTPIAVKNVASAQSRNSIPAV